jgi:hypothetical protein
MVLVFSGFVFLNLYRNSTVPIPIRSILFCKTGVNEGKIQMDKTNPEDLKIKDLLFMSIKLNCENIF